MATTQSGKEITFVISGQALPTGQPSVRARGTVRGAAQVGATRGAGDMVRLTARPGDDVVVLQIANGPALYLHPEDARDLLLAQVKTGGASRGAAAAKAARDSNAEVSLPSELAWPQLEEGIPGGGTRGGATRSLLGRVWVSAIEVIGGITKDEAADLTAAGVTLAVDNQVITGLYKLAPERLPALKKSGLLVDKAPARGGNPPLLVLLHGTFVETTSTFGKLWLHHPKRVRALFDRYGSDGVYAFDHRTLGDSPIANALELAKSVPPNAKLHLVTHSRGGLVAETLVRACAEVAAGVNTDPFMGSGYEAHRRDLKELKKLIAAQRISVERVVRVACPARGTLLASNRLTAYLSVLKWGLELAHVPVAPELVDFLTEVARRRADPKLIPGLAAMMPDNPVVQWITGPIEATTGSLRVVAGDMQGDSIIAWLKTLLSDAFYWTDNDLVVQTRSMYGGVPRIASAGTPGSGASFLLDQGGEVNHFNYFKNERSADAITRALIEDSPDGFATIGPMSWSGDDAGGTRARRRSHADPSQVPAVFVLPGILGSHLKVDGKRIWLGWRFFNNLKAVDYRHPKGQVENDGAIGAIYDKLIGRLSDTHDVHEFGYDWRVPLEHEAKRLAEAISVELDKRKGSQQPLRIVAHSMGGLLARTMQLERPAVWQAMMARPGARLLMLGTPNGGSWAPMQVLSGDDSFGNTLVATGSLFDDSGAREMMAQMPGFIQLQAALTDGALDLSSKKTWQSLADDDMAMARQYNIWHSDERQLSVYKWGVPEQEVIEQAVALRKRLDAQVPNLAEYASKMLLVVGKAPFTPAGVRTVEQGVEYLDAPEHGDGRVTFTSACLPNVRTWRVDASHGSLPSEKGAFDGYMQLLETGDTTLLDAVTGAGGTRGRAVDMAGSGPGSGAATRLQVARPARQTRGGGRPPSDIASMFGESPSNPDAIDQAARPQPALHISIVNGNLKFISQPLLLGHYKSLALTGSEEVIDNLLAHSMSQSLATGLYPSALGSHQVFINRYGKPEDPFTLPRPAAVVVAGLGEEGKLRSKELSDTIRQATIAYAQRVAESTDTVTNGFEFAATLIGSGGQGIDASSAARAVASGVQQANGRLAKHGWPIVTHLRLIELYLDRATEAHQALRMLAAARSGEYQLDGQIFHGVGPLRRPPGFGYRGARYDFISVSQRPGAELQPVIEFTLDSQRARNEVRAQGTQSGLVKELIRAGADDLNRDKRIGRSLFNLLVPIELQPFLAGSSSVVLQLDDKTATIPWEMLDTVSEEDAAAGDTRPWSVRTRMVRQLRTKEFREEPAMARNDHCVLVIGEPQISDPDYPPLPAAANEARAVAAALDAEPLIGSDALGVVNALMELPYRIVHVAGHGKLPDATSPLTGVVLANGTVLGPSEIKSMRTVPELAFINCCHLGNIAPGAERSGSAFSEKLPQFAAGVAEALINIGVRCVVAAGWAVEDDAAQVFATTFYKALLGGERFLDAVGQAREAAWKASPEGNTWAAYQCYGDPEWTYTPSKPRTPLTAAQRLAGHAIVSSVGLATELETIAVTARFDGNSERRAVLLADVQQIEANFEATWGRQGAVAEAFGVAYDATGDRRAAIRWYEAALAAEDASASMKATEQLANLLARHGEGLKDVAAGRKQIERAIAMLDGLVALRPTGERHSLLGSAWKRLAMLEARDKKPNKVAIKAMAEQYRIAEKLARDEDADNLFYPALNRMSAELALNVGNPNWTGFNPSDIAAVRQSLAGKATRDPDFWSVVNAIELDIYEALAKRRFKAAWPALLKRLTDAKARASGVSNWDSVHAQARFTLGDEAGGDAAAEVAELLSTLERFKSVSKA